MQNNIDELTSSSYRQASDEDALQKLMQDAVKQYMTKIGEMEPSEEMTELTIKCQESQGGCKRQGKRLPGCP